MGRPGGGGLPMSPEGFWSLVGPPDDCGCRRWLGKISELGYGVFYEHRRVRLAHRRAFELTSGPFAPGMCGLHRCDNTWCVAPDHIFVGTRADNIRDMVAKGRHRQGRAYLRQPRANGLFVRVPDLVAGR